MELPLAHVLKCADNRIPAIIDEMTGTIARDGLMRLGPCGG